jgi:hypothetical protein
MIEKLGSEEAYKAHMREIARKKRPNSKGGSFRNTEFAKKMGIIGARKRWGNETGI